MLTFQKASKEHTNTIFTWLQESHIQEFWDNSQAHKEDILKFVEGRKQLSSYCDGKFVYWIVFQNQIPYGMIMTIQETLKDNIEALKRLPVQTMDFSFPKKEKLKRKKLIETMKAKESSKVSVKRTPYGHGSENLLRCVEWKKQRNRS